MGWARPPRRCTWPPSRRPRAGAPSSLVDSDPQAGTAAEWVEVSDDERLERLTVVEAPTERLLARALGKLEEEDVAIVDSPPGQERFLAAALSMASVAVIPRPRRRGRDLARRCRARPRPPQHHRRARDLLRSAVHPRLRRHARHLFGGGRPGVGECPRAGVAIAAGPTAWLAEDGLEAFRAVSHTVQHRRPRRLTDPRRADPVEA